MKYRICIDGGHLSYRGKSSWCLAQSKRIIKELAANHINATLEPCNEQH